MKVFRFLNGVVTHVLAVFALIFGGMIIQSIMMKSQPELSSKIYGTEE